MWPPPSGPRHTPSRAPVLYAPPGISRRASMPASLPTNSPTTTQRENAAPFRAQALPRGVVGLEGGPAADQVGGPFGDRDRGGVGVAARDGRHDGRVHDPQPLDPADPQLGVADRVAVAPIAQVPPGGTASRPPGGRSRRRPRRRPARRAPHSPPTRGASGPVAAISRAWRTPATRTSRSALSERYAGSISGLAGVGGAQRERAAARHGDRGDHDRQEPLGHLDEPLVHERRGQDVVLQVGRGQPLDRPDETARLREVGRVGPRPSDWYRARERRFASSQSAFSRGVRT